MESFRQLNKHNLVEILEKLVSGVEAVIIIADKDAHIVYANQNLTAVTGCVQDDIIGQNIYDFLGIDSSDISLINKIDFLVKENNKFETITRKKNSRGETIYLDNTIAVLTGDDGVKYYLAISKDITHTHKLKQQVYKASYFDSLTDLPNQRTFLDAIKTYTEISKQDDIKFNIILIDISKTGNINNTYGFAAGDIVIQEVGNRIRKVLGLSDILAKFKDDMFAILHTQLTGNHEAAMLLDLLEKELRYPIKINEADIYIEFKAGIATYPDHTDTYEDLIDKAQVALTKAKSYNKFIHYMFYTPEIQKEVEKQIEIEIEMYRALENNEFDVYYQPFLDLNSNKIVGMEALLRRIKSNGEIILPGSFINVLEQMKLMEKVGLIIVEKVCKQIRKWIDKGYKVVPVAINLSPLQFENPDLAKNIIEVLEKYNISPELIILEITETVVIQDVELTQVILDELKQYGFAIALDDFGTGYSSIGYLKQFTFDHLKIDISFIRGILKDEQDKGIVEAIISIAKALNLKTIAEGIEEEEQLKIINSMGCEMGQGFLWDRPISAEMIEEKYIQACE